MVARIRGRNSGRKPLILLAHLDVVEAIKSDWSDDLDPFVFTERDGYYYGRGTADDKAMASIFVANVFRLKAGGLRPRSRHHHRPDGGRRERRLQRGRLAAGESSRAGGWRGLVINEGGGGTLRNGKPLFNSVQATEKITTNITLRVTNRGGHSSVPRADNAIYSLASALDEGRGRTGSRSSSTT